VTRRTWIACAVAAGMLAAAVPLTTALGGSPQRDVGGTAIALGYVTSTGAICDIDVIPVVHTPDVIAWWAARHFLERVDLQSLDPVTAEGDGEVASVLGALSAATEEEVFRRSRTVADVTLESDYTCTVMVRVGMPEIVGDDLGREPTALGGRPPDAVGFFRASTGEICEVQISVDPDWASGATDDAGAREARAYLASIDFTTVDYSVTLREMTDFWPDEDGEREASALLLTLTRVAHSAFDTTNVAALPISISGWSQCNPL
jgi:hypothetical protein